MSDKKKYIVITVFKTVGSLIDDSRSLDDVVCEHMKEGYVPLGGVSVSYNGRINKTSYSQAMILKEVDNF